MFGTRNDRDIVFDTPHAVAKEGRSVRLLFGKISQPACAYAATAGFELRPEERAEFPSAAES